MVKFTSSIVAAPAAAQTSETSNQYVTPTFRLEITACVMKVANCVLPDCFVRCARPNAVPVAAAVGVGGVPVPYRPWIVMPTSAVPLFTRPDRITCTLPELLGTYVQNAGVPPSPAICSVLLIGPVGPV